MGEEKAAVESDSTANSSIFFSSLVKETVPLGGDKRTQMEWRKGWSRNLSHSSTECPFHWGGHMCREVEIG